MRYNKRSSSACDWPFHFTPLFYQNRPPPSCHPKLYSSECQCHTLCFAAPKVFLTSCNFDENKKSVLKTNWQALPRAGLISSYEFQKAQLFIWFNLVAAQRQSVPAQWARFQWRTDVNQAWELTAADTSYFLLYQLCRQAAPVFSALRRRDQVFRKEIISLFFISHERALLTWCH